MTVKSIKAVRDLFEEMRADGKRPVAYVYERKRGTVRFAVFPDSDNFDLDVAPEVAAYARLWL